MTGFSTRPARSDDAPAIAAVLHAVHGQGGARDEPPPDAARVAVMLQTGTRFLVAEHAGKVVGTASEHHDDGIAWIEALASTRPGAGRALAAAIERHAQDAGLRLVRAAIPATGRCLALFSRWGYLPIAATTGAGGERGAIVERRLPLLTVRAQRRSDAPAIAALSGADPWPFEREARPGWFVLADGERVAGVVSVRETGPGSGRVEPLVLAATHHGRGLEAWLIERAAGFAAGRGWHTIEVEATPALDALRRTLEERRWFREGSPSGGRYARRLEAGDAADLRSEERLTP